MFAACLLRADGRHVVLKVVQREARRPAEERNHLVHAREVLPRRLLRRGGQRQRVSTSARGAGCGDPARRRVALLLSRGNPLVLCCTRRAITGSGAAGRLGGGARLEAGARVRREVEAVLGLEVAVNDAARVEVLHGAEELREHARGLALREHVLAREALEQLAASAVLRGAARGVSGGAHEGGGAGCAGVGRGRPPSRCRSCRSTRSTRGT